MIVNKKENFIPKYVGTYRILKRVCNVAYEINLPATCIGSSSLTHFLIEKVSG